MLIPIVLLGTPVLALLYFVVSLCLYIAAKRKNRNAPGSVDDETMQQRKSSLIYSGIILATFLAAIGGLIALLYTAVAFM